MAVITATATLAPLVLAGGVAPSQAALDPAVLRGVVTLPDGRAGAAAVIDFTALNADGTEARAFHRTVADRDGRFATRLPTRPALRMLAARNGGTLRVRADVTDIASRGQGVPVDAFGTSVTGTVTFTAVPSPYGAVSDPRVRVAATLVDTVLRTLAVLNPTRTLAIASEQSALAAAGTVAPADALRTVVRRVADESQPGSDDYLDELLGSSLVSGTTLQKLEAMVLDLPNYLLRVINGLPSGDEHPPPDTGQVVDDLTRMINQIVGIGDLGALQEEAWATIDQAVATATPIADQAVATATQTAQAAVAVGARALDTATVLATQAVDTANALAGLVVGTALGLITNPPDAQPYADAAWQVVGEAAGLAPVATALVGSTWLSAMTAIKPYRILAVDAAARLKNVDEDMLLGNDDVDDPELVPPLFAVLDVIPITDADDTGLVPEAPGGLDGGYGTDAESSDGGTAGCSVIKRLEKPGKGQPAPTWGIKMRVILKLYRCAEDDGDPFHDYYAWDWRGKITNEDVGGEWYTHIVRFKFRTQLNAAFSRDAEDPSQDIPVSGSQRINWNVGFNAGPVSGGVSGSYTAVKAKRIHPWSDYNGTLYHVSWMSNKTLGSRDDDFYNGGGNTFATPQGETGVSIKARNEIQIWKCWSHYSPDPWGAEGDCDPR